MELQDNSSERTTVVWPLLAETADLLTREPETLVASEAKSLPALNMRGVLYPLANFDLQIYKTIPKDLEAASF